LLLPRVITKLVGWAVAVFYDVERTGPPLVDGAVLVTMNHPNALVDPLVIFRTGQRPSRPLAKASLFDQALTGTLLRGLGGLPVYRRQDDPALMHLNERTFDAAVSALQAGEAVQIYPEGRSHSEPSLTPIRTGAARIALRAAAERDWTLDVQVQPVGLTYTRKHLFRGRVVAAFGEPFSISEFQPLYDEDDRAAVRELTDRIRRGLESLTLNFDHPDDRELVEVAERLYARQKKLVRWRERDLMANRLPRLRAFASGVRWLRATDPERLTELRQAVRRYLRLLTLLGASEGDVPPTYRFGIVLRYSIRQLFMLTLVLPVAVLGVAVWALPYGLTRHVAPRFRPKLDQVATYKLGMAILAFPLWWGLTLLAAWFQWGLGPAALVAAALPAAGLAAIAWRERQAQVRQDVLVFWRAIKHRGGRDRLLDQRTALVGAFDELTAAWQVDRGRA